MSDTHRISPTSPIGEVEHATLLSRDIGNMFCNEEYSNVTLVVEGRQFHAHRDILAARCHYFRALLFGGLMESDPECHRIELKDTNAQAFETLLRYIYTGRMNLLELKEETLLEMMGLAHRYGFVELEGAISDYLRAILNRNNVCLIYDVATLYCLDSLKQTCYMYMDSNAVDVMESESFLSLSESALKEVISRDSFYASEVQIFRAVARWSESNSQVDLIEIVKAIRLPLMSFDDILNVVRPSKLLSPNSILDAIQEKHERKDTDLNYRGMMIPDENIATTKFGARVMKGEHKTTLLDGNHCNYDLDKGFTRHSIEDEREADGIVIELNKPTVLNTIRLLLWDKDNRSYSYYIEASVDEMDWIEIIDHRPYLCRSWQTLHFPARVCKFKKPLKLKAHQGTLAELIEEKHWYIRIVGTFNSSNKVFHLVSFECYYSTRLYDLDPGTGLIVPKDNMATTEQSAIVVEGVSRSRNALLNGDTRSYDWDSGYTCHQLGSGSIMVQLSQPYRVSSMRLLLWDCDNRTYGYYVEVSTNQQNWHRVADKTKEQCSSWQTLRFEPRPVTFIRIVGTRNTANEVFHCVHFECPANLMDPSSPSVHGDREYVDLTASSPSYA